MKHVKILILGGGLTGLSTAYHLEKMNYTDYLLAEKEPQAGGLCQSHTQGGFTYDLGGHLLHLHTPYGKKLVKELLKDNLVRLQRHAWIDTPHNRIAYPFQANLFALPEAEKQACIDGLIHRKKFLPKPHTFEQWCLQNFGKGIYEQFFKPYNTKLWGLSPKQLTCEWCAPFVPVPSEAAIRQGARQATSKTYGYNAYFYYPRKGGIGALPRALAASLHGLHLSTPVQAVDLSRKTAVLNGETISFDYLVNTLPLPHFIALLTGQKRLKTQAEKLVSQPITVWSVGVQGKIKKPFSWIYFPQTEIPFFRVGLQSGFSSSCAPAGASLLYIELAGKKTLTSAHQKQILNILAQKGIITTAAKVVFSAVSVLSPAYAVYDKNRTRRVEGLSSYLEKKQVYVAGRYGRWEYSFMESSLLQGRETARKLLKILNKREWV